MRIKTRGPLAEGLRRIANIAEKLEERFDPEWRDPNLLLNQNGTLAKNVNNSMSTADLNASTLSTENQKMSESQNNESMLSPQNGENDENVNLENQTSKDNNDESSDANNEEKIKQELENSTDLDKSNGNEPYEIENENEDTKKESNRQANDENGENNGSNWKQNNSNNSQNNNRRGRGGNNNFRGNNRRGYQNGRGGRANNGNYGVWWVWNLGLVKNGSQRIRSKIGQKSVQKKPTSPITTPTHYQAQTSPTLTTKTEDLSAIPDLPTAKPFLTIGRQEVRLGTSRVLAGIIIILIESVTFEKFMFIFCSFFRHIVFFR